MKWLLTAAIFFAAPTWAADTTYPGLCRGYKLAICNGQPSAPQGCLPADRNTLLITNGVCSARPHWKYFRVVNCTTHGVSAKGTANTLTINCRP